MGTLRYALAAALALSMLEVLESSSSAAGRVGGFFDGIATASSYLLSPAYPLVPDRRKASTSSTPATPAPPDNGGGDDPTLPAPPPISTPPTSTGVISV